jgi:hypothetical protein
MRLPIFTVRMVRSGPPVSHRRTLAVAIGATAALGETLRFAIRATLGFLRRLHDTGGPKLR